MATLTTPHNSDNNSMQATVRHVGENLKGLQSDATELASAVGEEIKARVGNAAEVTKQQAQRVLETTRTQVREHPAATIGIAAGAGFLIGLLLASRR